MADTGLSEESMMELYDAISTGMHSVDTKKTTRSSASTSTATRKRKQSRKDNDDTEAESLPEKAIKAGGKSRRRRKSTKRRICRKKHRHTKKSKRCRY
jgi:hypothetical protein